MDESRPEARPVRKHRHRPRRRRHRPGTVGAAPDDERVAVLRPFSRGCRCSRPPASGRHAVTHPRPRRIEPRGRLGDRRPGRFRRRSRPRSGRGISGKPRARREFRRAVPADVAAAGSSAPARDGGAVRRHAALPVALRRPASGAPRATHRAERAGVELAHRTSSRARTARGSRGGTHTASASALASK